MSSIKTALFDVAQKAFFRAARVTRIHSWGERLVGLELQGAALQGVAWTPGDKIQMRVADSELRTYTPVLWDSARGRTELLIHLHGDAPGARKIRQLSPDDTVHFFGPRGSLSLAPEEPAVLFGDETSLGVAAAFQTSRHAATRRHWVFEVDEPAPCQAALAHRGLADATLVVKRSDGAHFPEMLAAAIEALRKTPDATRVFTGRAKSIQLLRKGLQQNGSKASGRVAVKAYWAPGKAGLD